MTKFIKHFYINLFFASFLFAQLNVSEYVEWNNLQNDDVTIAYSWGQEFPLCKADIKLNYTIDQILSIIENVNNYYMVLDLLYAVVLSIYVVYMLNYFKLSVTISDCYSIYNNFIIKC